jgi:hypothetical protein
MKRILFIDRDGTLIKEAPPSYQIDSFEKLSFYPGMFEYMGRIARELDYELLMVGDSFVPGRYVLAGAKSRAAEPGRGGDPFQRNLYRS